MIEKLDMISKKYFNKRYLINNKYQIIKICLISIFLLTILFSILLNNNTSKKDDVVIPNDNTAVADMSEKENIDRIFVDISGEVKMPMVLEIDSNSRVQDAIDMAGGLTEEADISSINRAEKLRDGQKITIPSKNSSQGQKMTTSGIVDGKVNINLASSEELQTVNGIGPGTAKKIIDYRNKNGQFKEINEIKNINGIGEKTYDKMKNDIFI
ncbi:MAG: helix-hairpin-helix domain-containing protein [Eubacteriales bacterium]|nr:helix-hairpin-helix domain-containing protein [Eubacteriales bacterium]MDY3332960.1 helix-hairpin-helix domain-containing protein [Gallibacter sp.]